MRNRTVGRLVAVDQGEPGGRVQGLNRAPHGKHGCLEDIDRIDNLLLDHAEADSNRFGPDRQIKLLALPCAEGLGVVHSLDRAAGRKDHGGSHDRPGQRPASDLINARNKLIPCGAKVDLYLCGRQRGDRLQVSLRSEILAALPLSFRR